MRLEIDSDLAGALLDVVAIDAFRERLVLHLFPDGLRLDLVNRAIGPDEHGCRDETAQLVAGEERLREPGLARHAGILRMAEDGFDHLFGIAVRGEDPAAFEGMTLRLRSVEIVFGKTLVIEIVEEPGVAPKIFVLPPELCIPPHRRFHRKRVLPQAVARGVLAEKRPGFVARLIHSSPD